MSSQRSVSSHSNQCSTIILMKARNGVRGRVQATKVVYNFNAFFTVCFVCDVVDVATAGSDQEACFLCESPVDVKFEPCGHAMMCSTCAQRAKKCPQCKVRLSCRLHAILLALSAPLLPPKFDALLMHIFVVI